MATKKKKMQWWTEIKDDAHRAIFNTVQTIHDNSRDRYERNLRCLKLYGNADIAAIGPASYLSVHTPSLPDNRVRLNIVSSMVDTSGSKISKMKPRVSFLTSGGDFSSQRQAKQLTKFMLGAFYMNKIHELHQQGFRDSQIMDLGILKHFHDKKRIYSERCLAMELYVDPMDALYGKPKCLYQVKYVARDVLKAHFPDHESAIDMAREQVERNSASMQVEEEFVCVIEAWRLPTKPGADDGRHVICVDKHSLVDEDYTRSYFPFTFF